jgi:hypothetical protein
LSVVETFANQYGETAAVSARPPLARYAVLFRIHVWDAFVERQYHRLLEQCPGGDVFIVANNTSGNCNPVGGLPWVEFRESDLEAMGLARAGDGELLWFNIDYALYFFLKLKSDYDHYVLVEYDVMATSNIDRIVLQAQIRAADLVGVEHTQPVREWYYLKTCDGVYHRDDVRKMLFPFGIFSKRAIEYLFSRRLSLSQKLREGAIETWPHCEFFVTTELHLAQYNIDELKSYDVAHKIDYQPAYFEHDIEAMAETDLVHPVLDAERFVRSAIHYDKRPERYFLPSSEIHRKLVRFPVSMYAGPLSQALRKRIGQVPDRLSRKITSAVANENSLLTVVRHAASFIVGIFISNP